MIDTATINITLTDENDNQPIFIGAPYLVTIPEGTRGPQVVLTVVATDEDSSTNGQIEYFTAGGTVGDFRIDTNTVSILQGICMQGPPCLLRIVYLCSKDRLLAFYPGAVRLIVCLSLSTSAG